MRLSDAAIGKDNNFNLVRLVAAFAVLLTHSFAIATGDPRTEPLRMWLGMTIGDFAVDGFFITSGFLVTASLARRQSTRDFVRARVLRIYPALLVMVGLTVFVVGPLLTALSVVDYLSHSATLRYLAKCATLIFGVAYLLPGVFEGNPYKAVNGSLWSMPWELRMYLLLLGLWLGAKFVTRGRGRAWEASILIVFIISALSLVVAHFAMPRLALESSLLFMFFTGAAFHVLRERIVLRASGALTVAAALFLATVNKDFFFLVYSGGFAYLLMYLAYAPAGVFRNFNRLGDYSYGTYIYAFPVQQLITAARPGISVSELFLISAPATLALAVASWHLIEHRALRLKRGTTSSFAKPQELSLGSAKGGDTNAFNDPRKGIFPNG